MALPPIITNSPIFKALSGVPAETAPRKAVAENAEKIASSPVEDRVDLSEAARARIESRIESESSARQTAGDVRAELELDPELTLG